MLIDARHPEETRVAVVNGNRIEEFDFESAARKQLKGNIYLAKVTRVEPSLQAAFIEYGGNRHGFLAFSEIHPDYYQIPKEDREALLREEREAAQALEAHHDEHDHDEDHDAEPHADGDEDAPVRAPEETGAHDESTTEALRKKRMSLRRRYKIQEVIHRRQVLLVQVVKEERGNKGAALTTYLSLAGRYSVLMPNTHNGGGISRKISNQAERKKLKSLISDLKLPQGMACIIRTAGTKRTKTEIKRDFDYLTRLWDGIRDLTLQSTAPALIHQDSDLLKRAIRDIYSREIDQVLVDGEGGYKAAKDFMKLLMPSHAKKVQQYADPVPLFQRFGVEGQLAAMYQPVVQLKSGGYIVINPTEALVSIDINSGRSTREHNIEETALKTNLEAADEIARQLRLRDMAGLVVIDFIDMENHSNTRKVEKAMKAALANDRARIQVGRISSFGLMEMSRQRLRTGVLEASSHTCPVCEGAGIVRTSSSAALGALRGLEAEMVKGKCCEFTLRAGTEVAVYILNRKRNDLAELENRYGVTIEVMPDSEMASPHFAIEAAGGPPSKPVPTSAPLPAPVAADEEPEEIEEEVEGEDEEEETTSRRRGSREPREDREDRQEGSRGRGRRRRRRRGGRREDGDQPAAEGEAEDGEEAAEGAEAPADADAAAPSDGEGEERRRRRRGRRGGRRRNGAEGDTASADADADADAEPTVEAAPETVSEPAPEPEAEEAPKPKKRAARSRKKAEPAAEEAPIADAPVVEAPVVEAAPEPEPVAEEAPQPKKRATRSRKAAAAPAEPAVTEAAEVPAEAANDPEPATAETEEGAPERPRGNRKGWWQRTFGN
ncbi:ribonuclease E/G [Sphingoaurantiacus capsulatus]|uniref:Ribonuclease E n=2 Tax=Sphingoaurantiacus capsulatus TaxID=1771310 RepID=A0ABV7XD58_9SPHN